MSDLVTDPNDPRLKRGVDDKPVPQNAAYIVDGRTDKDFIRPVRHKYIHKTCGVVTSMSAALAETYARNPKFYGATYCVGCKMHRPVAEFLWDGTTEEVGS